jgi:hypothetical protein
MTAADSTPAQEVPREHSRLSHLRSAFAMSGAMLTALLALASGGIALFFQLRPDFAPDPRTHLGAAATVFAVDRNVSLGDFLARREAIVSPEELRIERSAYLKEAGASSTRDTKALFAFPGEDVFVQLNVEGFKSRSVAMIASMYDAKTRRRLRELDAIPVFSERLASPSDRSVVEFWLPAPPVTTRSYFVRVQVYHRGDGVLLAIADSKRIRAG